jgi:hypothetical protein
MVLKTEPDDIIASAQAALEADPELTPVKWACRFDRDAVNAGDAFGHQIAERQQRRQQGGGGPSRVASV